MAEDTISLSQFVRESRENLGLSLHLLAIRSNLTEEQVSDIESGKDLFLSATVRQKLAKGLKINPSEIKKHEKNVEINYGASKSVEDEIRGRMNAGETSGLFCPVCGAELTVRVVKRYDLEDNLILHHKAICTKCPFQII
ncbi:MAG: helix-turn-helix domain-containing protein [Candidatus Gastranaerophilaceae bacterium]